MEPFRDEQDLIAELRTQRPQPSPEFSAELDERVAAGFPRRSRRLFSPLGRLPAWLASIPPRRALVPAGTVALLALVVAAALVSTREASENLESGGGGRTLSHIEYFGEGAGPAAAETASEAAPSAGAPERSSSAALAAPEAVRPDTGPYAARADRLRIERSAQIVLGADPADIGKDAAKVFDAVHAVDGIVLRSSVSDGPEGEAGAAFDLLIPSAKLSDALAAFSAIDVVVSRHDATEDITAATVSTGERLQDSQAKIDGLLVQLAGADSDSERVEVETELRRERRHAAALRTSLAKLDRRANLSRVSLRIETAGASGGNSGGVWGIGDALHDAGHILAIAAGVTIVGLAVLAPLALIAVLAWLAHRALIRRSRERALE